MHEMRWNWVRVLRHVLVVPLVFGVFAGCAGVDGVERTVLQNADGKADRATVSVHLTAEAPTSSFEIRCEYSEGCEGTLDIVLVDPAPCEIITDPGCGMGPLAATRVPLGNVTIDNGGATVRTLPFALETADGDHFTVSIAAAFAGRTGHAVTFDIAKDPAAPDVTLEVSADWHRTGDDSGTDDLLAYLSTVPGLTYVEVGTQYRGYRAFLVSLDTPVDHNGADSRTFPQTFVIHHRKREAPMVLYTQGYELPTHDALSELTEGLGSNQIYLEHRFFGNSIPAGVVNDDWKWVTIAEAAADEHRVVEVLKPFYSESWISTGHSKGGMTALFHRRFFPDDVDATVAYVTPISFAVEDPRYIPFLDQIGEPACHDKVRDVMVKARQRFNTLVPYLDQVSAQWGLTYNRVGGHAAQMEKALETFEWGFWQYWGVEQCANILSVSSNEEIDRWGLYMTQGAWSDQSLDAPIYTYAYQAEYQLGRQAMSTAFLEPYLQYQNVKEDYLPEGVHPTFDPTAMPDIQGWVTAEGARIVFLYGEYDPWFGGAYDVSQAGPEILKVVAPRKNHGAAIRHLAEADRTMVLDAIERWTGARPAINAEFQPSFGQNPPRLLLEGLQSPVFTSQQ